MAITFWRNVQRKITTQEMDASFDTLVNDIANAGISSEMPEGTIYIGDNTNTASLETLDTSIVPETTDKRYQSDLQDTYNDATSSIQGQLDDKLDLDGGNANQDIDIGNYSLNAKHVKINGTAGSGHLGLKHQSANITASASESSIGANSVGNPVWKNDGNAIDELELISRKTNNVTGNETSTTKYLSVKGIYDWAVGLFAPISSPTFTGTVTTPDIIVSGATASTIAHFDGSKNIESLPTATYPDLTELSYVKGVTSAIQTQINTSNNQVAYETWNTDANYTTINTTAKRLIVLQTGTLTATRTLSLASVTGAGQEVVIIAGGSVSSTIKITVTCGNKINVTLNSFDITLAYSQTWLTSTATNSFTSQQATVGLFTDDGTTVTTTRRLKASYFAGGINTSMPSMIGFGDFTSIRLGNSVGMATYQSGGYKFIPQIDGVSFWTQEITGNTNLQYYDGTDVGNGAYPLYTRNSYYGGWAFFSVSNPTTYIEGYYYNVGTISQLIITKPTSNSGALQVALVSNKIAVTTNSALTFAKQQLLNTWLNSELPQLNESWSTSGTTKYLTNLGIGHTSQSASAILQADSTTKGFLPPRMTNTQRTNIVSPAIGLMVYCTDATEGLYVYKSTGWTFII
jgi:hypothetical protein